MPNYKKLKLQFHCLTLKKVAISNCHPVLKTSILIHCLYLLNYYTPCKAISFIAKGIMIILLISEVIPLF